MRPFFVVAFSSLVLGACGSSPDAPRGAEGDASPPADALSDSAPAADAEDVASEDTAWSCTVAVSKGPWVVAVDGASAKVRWESCRPGVAGIHYAVEKTGTPEAPDSGAEAAAISEVTETVIPESYQAPLQGDADHAGTYWSHEVALRGLRPSTCYAYRLDSDATKVGRFCTARASGESFSFVAIGDTNPGLGRTKPLLDVYKRKPDFTIHGGDIQYYASFIETYARWFDIMAPMMSGGGFFPAIGNHESEKPDERRLYVDRFWGGAGFDGNNDWYRFESGGVWFFSLNTELPIRLSSEQGRWLSAQLADAAKRPGFRFSVVFMHRPLVTCGDTGDAPAARKELEPVFLANGVKLVVQAHMHGYERFEIGDLTYVTTGGGGGVIHDVDQHKERETCVFRKVRGRWYHLMLLDVKPGELAGSAIDGTGKVLDSFSKKVP